MLVLQLGELAACRGVVGQVRSRERSRREQYRLASKRKPPRLRCRSIASGLEILWVATGRGSRADVPVGELQGILGAAEAKIAVKQAAFGGQQAEIGKKQAELGRQQAELGRQQAKLAREASQQMRMLIDNAFRNGQAKPANLGSWFTVPGSQLQQIHVYQNHTRYLCVSRLSESWIHLNSGGADPWAISSTI